jgi:hypothetical protein
MMRARVQVMTAVMEGAAYYDALQRAFRKRVIRCSDDQP